MVLERLTHLLAQARGLIGLGRMFQHESGLVPVGAPLDQGPGLQVMRLGDDMVLNTPYGPSGEEPRIVQLAPPLRWMRAQASSRK